LNSIKEFKLAQLVKSAFELIKQGSFSDVILNFYLYNSSPGLLGTNRVCTYSITDRNAEGEVSGNVGNFLISSCGLSLKA
jgi:hypothetical protein